MANFYIVSPVGVPLNPVLFPMFKEAFERNGHRFVDAHISADIYLVDLHTRIADYSEETLQLMIESGKPIVTFDEWDRGSMSEDEWPYPLTKQQDKIFNHIKYSQTAYLHFCRLLNKNNVPPCLYPYEKPILYEEPICTPDELYNREFDICYIANSAPNREAIAQGLIDDGRLKCHISLGAKKLEFADFLQQHKKAKLFISSSAGGYTDERMQLLFSVAGMIKQYTDQYLLHDFTNLVNCIRISSLPTKDELDNIYEIVNDKERLYQLYLSQYKFIKTFYSKEYIAGNILQLLKQNSIIL